MRGGGCRIRNRHCAGAVGDGNGGDSSVMMKWAENNRRKVQWDLAIITNASKKATSARAADEYSKDVQGAASSTSSRRRAQGDLLCRGPSSR